MKTSNLDRPTFHLYRADAPVTSILAAYGVDATTWRERLLAFIQSQGIRGATLRDAFDYFDNPRSSSTISARMTDLHALGLTFRTAMVENGCHVYVAEDHRDAWAAAFPDQAAILAHRPDLEYTPPEQKLPIDGVYICPCCDKLLEWNGGRFILAGQKELF